MEARDPSTAKPVPRLRVWARSWAAVGALLARPRLADELQNPGKVPPMPLHAGSVLARPVIVAEVEIRPCRAEDLPQLEWYGLFGDHRQLFQSAFARHLLGENVM